MCCSGCTRTLQVYVFKCFSYSTRMLQLFFMLQSRSGCFHVLQWLYMYIVNLYPNVSFVLKRMLQLFSFRCCKTSSTGCKSTSTSRVHMQNRATGTARAKRRGWDGPTGPCTCNGAGRTARETEWDGMNLPRVELRPDTTSCPDIRAPGISSLGGKRRMDAGP
jgi:hypothetical protein